MTWIQVFLNNIFKLKINGTEVGDKYKVNLDKPKWNQKTLKASRYQVLKSGTIYHTMLNPLKTMKLSQICLKKCDISLCNCNSYKNRYLLKSFIPRYYLFSLFYFFIRSFLINVIYINNFFKRLLVNM